MSSFDPDDFVVLYPGVYTKKEKALVEKCLADNKALEERSDIDVQALINSTLPKDTPGLGPSYVASEAMVRYNNEKYDPENLVLNDAEYAKKLGYKDIIGEVDDSRHGAGGWVPPAIAVKQAVSIPVIAVGRLDPELSEGLLRHGAVDFVSFNRRLMADPELPNKLAEGRLEDICPCTGCLTCFDNGSCGFRGETPHEPS